MDNNSYMAPTKRADARNIFIAEYTGIYILREVFIQRTQNSVHVEGPVEVTGGVT